MSEQKTKVGKVPIINALLSILYFHTVSPLWTMLLSNYKILKVLLDGLHDPESSLNMLREPNDVRRPVMEMIWGQVTEDWQVCCYPHHHRQHLWDEKALSSHSDQTCHGRCSTKEVLLIRIPVHLCRRENTIYDVHPFNLSISTTGKNVVVEVFRSPVKEMLPSAFYASLSIPVSSLEKLKSSFSSRVEPLPFTEVYLVAGVSCRHTGRSNCWGAKKEV